MPQIRCPHCGARINLETRKETDFRMILSSLKRGPKTFTDLLRATELPRKTLSLRLKELSELKLIIKDGGYRLNDEPPSNLGGEMLERLNKPTLFTRKRVIVLFLILCIAIPASSYVQANLRPKEEKGGEVTPPPFYYGNLTIAIRIQNVTDLFTWQVKLNYNPEELDFLGAWKGDFFGKNKASLGVFVKDKYGVVNWLVVGDTLIGKYGQRVPGVSGSGTLAIVKFAIKIPTAPITPEIVFDQDTFLVDSYGQDIPSAYSMVSIERM